MDAKQEAQQKRNPNVQRVFMPFFVFFFIAGFDFIHDSFNQLPMYLKIYLLVANVIGFILRIGSAMMIFLAFAKSTMDIGAASMLTSILVTVLNSLVAHTVFALKWPQVRKMLNQLDKLSSDIMDNDSVFHKKALGLQRRTMLSIIWIAVAMVANGYQNGAPVEIDSWIFKNASVSCYGYSSRPQYLDIVYPIIQLSFLMAHSLFVGFFTVFAFYVQGNFECLREKSMNEIRELKKSSSSSILGLIKTANNTIVWDTEKPAHKNRRRFGGPQHPIWALLRRHQALSQLVTLMDDTFREVMIIWSFSELTILIFMIRAMNLSVTLNDHFFEIILLIIMFTAMFLTKSLRAGGINDQVG